MNDRIQQNLVTLDTTARQPALTPLQDSKKTMAFAYAPPDSARLELVGAAGGDSLRIALRRTGPEGSLLVDRGFHWINISGQSMSMRWA